MLSRIVASGVVLMFAASPSRDAVLAAQDDTLTIGVVLPHGQIGQGADIATPTQFSLMNDLRGAHLQVVALESSDMQQAVAEGAQKNCAYVLLTRISQSRGKSGGGLLNKMAMLKPSRTPNYGLAPSADAQGGENLAAVEHAVIKSGDNITLEYRLMARGGMAPASEGKLEGKAQADGDDVLSPLLAQLTGAVASAANGGRRGRNGKGSANTAPPPNMNCEQMAAAAHGSISVEACKQMMGAQAAYVAAANDPTASRPGDDKMNCDQIVAEVKQQQFTAPDKAKLAEAQAASTDMQQTLAKQQKEVTEKALAENAALLASDASLGGLTGATTRLAEKFDAENKAMGERMAKESAPKVERTTNATGEIVADMGKQLTENPRLARLMQMASAKKCKGL
jgi:hypothetical protein